MALEWQKDERGLHRTEGWVIEQTGNPYAPHALYQTRGGRPDMYACTEGTLEECQRAAESLTPKEFYDDDDEEK